MGHFIITVALVFRDVFIAIYKYFFIVLTIDLPKSVPETIDLPKLGFNQMHV